MRIHFFETHSFNLDSLSHDVQLIKQTLQGWTSIFSQLMEIIIKTQKQNLASVFMICYCKDCLIMQQLLASKRPKPPQEQIKLSPIRPTKTEPDEILRQDNFSKIFKNPKRYQFQHNSRYQSCNFGLHLIQLLKVQQKDLRYKKDSPHTRYLVIHYEGKS